MEDILPCISKIKLPDNSVYQIRDQQTYDILDILLGNSNQSSEEENDK